jgi:hypothetical protein
MFLVDGLKPLNPEIIHESNFLPLWYNSLAAGMGEIRNIGNIDIGKYRIGF